MKSGKRAGYTVSRDCRIFRRSADGSSCTGNPGDLGGVESTETVLASDYPVFWTG